MSIQSLTGQTLGQYELRELLGTGGMGAVYRGYQSNLKRYVAVKILAANLVEQPGALERFNREAQTSAALEHTNIIRIYDYGTQRGISYLVMHLLTGGSLAERLLQRAGTDRPLPSLGEIAGLIKQLASALDYAHSQGVIHRDIKPSNIMFDNHGNAFLVDFGIAKLVQATSGLTASGMVIGTWGYMAPEQWKAETLTPATDQYALAVMTYALVTGQMPFDAPTPAGIMHRHLNEKPTPVHMRRADVPEAVTGVIERALAKNPEERFPTATAFAQAFDRAIRGQTGETTGFFTTAVSRHNPMPSAVLTPSQPVTAASPIYKHPAVWAMVVLVIVMAAVITFLLARDQNQSGQPGTTSAAQLASKIPDTVSSTVIAVPPESAIPTAALATVIRPSDTPTPTSTLTQTPAPTQTPSPTQTPTWTRTPTPTQTSSATPTVTQTPLPIETQVWLDITATQDAANALASATAAGWTYTPSSTPTQTGTFTPTPNATETYAAAMAAVIQTLTATMWTATPTSTPTSTPTITFTPSPLPAGSSNPAWIPVTQDFDGVMMAYVPAGCFNMGSYDGSSDEKPVHEVCLNAFWIDQTEVTNEQYGSSGNWSGDQRPRENVNWSEAQQFCESRGARLPTEAEWEYAARGPEGWTYPWGNDFVADNTVYGGNSHNQTADVGSRPGGVSWVGALDLSGNVWEWVADWYEETYPTGPQVNPTGPASGDARVVRGGSWNNDRSLMRAADRNGGNPTFRNNYISFRCSLPALN